MTMLMPLVRIKVKCPNLDTFIEKHHSDVNPVGIFVRTRSPLPAGTPISFDFRLADGAPLFRGSGVVVWARPDDTLAPLLDPGMMLSFDELRDGSRETFDQVLRHKRSLEEAADTVPTLVRTFTGPERPLPMTTKMSAEEMEALRLRMREQMLAEGNAPATPVELAPSGAVKQEPPEPTSMPLPLAKVLVLHPEVADTAPPLPPPPEAGPAADRATPAPPRQAHAAAGVIEARTPPPSDITAFTKPAPAATRPARLIGVGIASWMLVLFLCAMIRWDLLRRMLEWIGAA